MLADMNNNPLDPPAAPFGLTPSGSQTSLAADQRSNSNVSLAANYIPTKFSNTLLSPGPRKRKGKGLDIAVPKRGGGVEAFRSGEARMPNQNDEDYDGVSSGWFGGGGPKSSTKRLRWNRFKWTLIFSNAVVSLPLPSNFFFLFSLTSYLPVASSPPGPSLGSSSVS